MVTLSGPLNPGIIATICVLLLIRLLREKRMPSRLEWLTFAPVAAGSVYSLFLGLYNVISMRVDMPLWERYKVLPQGVWNDCRGTEYSDWYYQLSFCKLSSYCHYSKGTINERKKSEDC